MDRFLRVLLVGLAYFTHGAWTWSASGNDPWDGDAGLLGGVLDNGPLQGRHLVQRMAMSQIQEGIGFAGSRNERHSLFQHLVLFRSVASQIGEHILREFDKKRDDERVYTFTSFDGCDCAIEYVDKGIKKGFIPDFINAVCKEAGKRCVLTYNPTYLCFTHEGEIPHAGDGLLGRDVDVCMLWMNTTKRQLSVSFTEPILAFDNPATFHVKAGNPRKFDPTNLDGKRIGFINGLTSDQSCLAASKSKYSGGDSLEPENVLYLKNVQQLLEALTNEQIDAAFIYKIALAHALDGKFEKIGVSTECHTLNTLHGMKRKDNELAWFDETLREMKANGKYYAMCHKAKRDHGHMGDLQCLDD